MKFVQTAEHLYWWPIKVPKPDPQRTGHWKTETFEMQFRGVSRDRAQEILTAYNALTPEERAAHEHDQLLDASCNWRGVVDDNKEEVPFSPEMLVALLRADPWNHQGVYDSYYRSLNADTARRGN